MVARVLPDWLLTAMVSFFSLLWLLGSTAATTAAVVVEVRMRPHCAACGMLGGRLVVASSAAEDQGTVAPSTPHLLPLDWHPEVLALCVLLVPCNSSDCAIALVTAMTTLKCVCCNPLHRYHCSIITSRWECGGVWLCWVCIVCLLGALDILCSPHMQRNEADAAYAAAVAVATAVYSKR